MLRPTPKKYEALLLEELLHGNIHDFLKRPVVGSLQVLLNAVVLGSLKVLVPRRIYHDGIEDSQSLQVGLPHVFLQVHGWMIPNF